MKRMFCAVVLVASLMLSPAPAVSEPARGFDIVQIKTALRITPAQQPYWAKVEAVLTDIANRHEAAHAQASTMQRARHRVMTIVLDSAAVARLSAAARPLAMVLDDNQKRAAQDLARKMGLSHMLADLR